MADLGELFAAFNDRDWSRFDAVVAELFHPDFALHLPKQGAPALDRDAYGPTARAEVDRHPDLRYVLGASLADATTSVLVLERHVTLAGRATVIPLCLVAEQEAGRIHVITEYAGSPYRP